MDDRPHVSLKYVRSFPYPIDVAYAWLTDYQDDDPQRAGALVRKRNVVQRTDREVHVDGHLEILGRDYEGKAVIHLFPEEKRWKAVIGHGAWQFHYKLTSTGPSSCRLDVDYQMGSRKWIKRLRYTLAKPFVRRELDRMWDGFAASMERELSQTPLTTA